MADLRLPLPPSIAGDARFQALALAVQDELDRIDAARPALLVTAIGAVTDPGVLAHLAWQWHVMGIEGWDFAADDQARRALVAAAIELHRYKGTPWAVRTALARVLSFAATVEEADAYRRRDGQAGGGWADWQMDTGRVPAPAEVPAIVTVATAWAPVRSPLVRLYHGYDLRAARFDAPLGNRRLYDTWSGVDLGGVRQSYGVTTTHGAEMPAGVPQAGAGWTWTGRVARTPATRWDAQRFDAPVPARRLFAAADSDEGRVLPARREGWGAGPWTDGPWGTAPAAFLDVAANGHAAPAAVPVSVRPAAVAQTAHRATADPAGRNDGAAVMAAAPVTADRGWGAGPWTDGPWGTATAGVATSAN